MPRGKKLSVTSRKPALTGYVLLIVSRQKNRCQKRTPGPSQHFFRHPPARDLTLPRPVLQAARLSDFRTNHDEQPAPEESADHATGMRILSKCTSEESVHCNANALRLCCELLFRLSTFPSPLIWIPDASLGGVSFWFVFCAPSFGRLPEKTKKCQIGVFLHSLNFNP